MTNEEIISDFMQRHYTDEKLAALLAHCEDGKFAFLSCCCFIGIPTATHALRGACCGWSSEPHYVDAAVRFCNVAEPVIPAEVVLSEMISNDERMAFLIPLIRSEMSRREALSNLKAGLSDLGETLKEVSV